MYDCVPGAWLPGDLTWVPVLIIFSLWFLDVMPSKVYLHNYTENACEWSDTSLYRSRFEQMCILLSKLELHGCMSAVWWAARILRVEILESLFIFGILSFCRKFQSWIQWYQHSDTYRRHLYMFTFCADFELFYTSCLVLSTSCVIDICLCSFFTYNDDKFIRFIWTWV